MLGPSGLFRSFHMKKRHSWNSLILERTHYLSMLLDINIHKGHRQAEHARRVGAIRSNIRSYDPHL